VLRLGFATAALRTAGVLARSSDERGSVPELADIAGLGATLVGAVALF